MKYILVTLAFYSLSLTASIAPLGYIVDASIENFSDDKIVRVSWYGSKFHGKKTASGAIYNMNGLSAAHKSLKFGTKVKITNIKNGKSVVVTINDRGPFVKDREFDLSKAAFTKISSENSGVISVNYTIL